MKKQRNKHPKTPKGPSRMVNNYEDMPGWEYHPTKGFRKNKEAAK